MLRPSPLAKLELPLRWRNHKIDAALEEASTTRGNSRTIQFRVVPHGRKANFRPRGIVTFPAGGRHGEGIRSPAIKVAKFAELLAKSQVGNQIRACKDDRNVMFKASTRGLMHLTISCFSK